MNMPKWILFHYATAEKIREYESLAAARTGMRTSNRNAGWTRASRCSTALIETEWCHAVDHTDRWEYGPYAIATERNWSVLKS